MKQKLKKSLSIILAAMMLICSVPFVAMLDNKSFKANAWEAGLTQKCGDNLTWNFDYDTDTLTISGTGEMYDYSTYGWSDVRMPWVDLIPNIKHLVFEEGVTSISGSAFSDYTGLLTVDFADTITYIGEQAFRECYSLEEVILPESLEHLDNYAFLECTSLASVTLPDRPINIGVYPFYETPFFDNLISQSTGAVYLGKHLMFVSSSETEFTVLPGTLSIAGLAFYNSNTENTLKKVIIPDTVKKIGAGAFMYCKALVEVNLPYGMTEICEAMFGGCESLTSISIPDSVKNIERNAFDESGIYNNSSNWKDGIFYYKNCLLDVNKDAVSGKSIAIKPGTKLISAEAFYETAITGITIPDSVIGIGEYAFSDCLGLTSVKIPGNIGDISYGMFADCENLVSIEIENGVTGIGEYAFNNTGLEKVIIPGSVEEIGEYAFRYAKAEEIVISEGVSKISAGAFTETNLNKISIPSSVNYISEYAFLFACFENISVSSQNAYYTTDAEGVLFDKQKTKLIRWPVNNDSTYYAIPNSVKKICDYAFYYPSWNLERVSVPDGVEYIGDYSLIGLRGVSVPSKAEYIGEYAFYGCEFEDKSIVIPSTVKTISTGAFSDSDIEKAVIREGVVSIEGEAFYCTNLSDISIPESVVWIDAGAIEKTELSQNESNWENGLLYVDNCLLDGDDTLDRVEIREGTRVIASGIFYDPDFMDGGDKIKITSVHIPDSVISIGTKSFNNCDQLVYVDLSANIKYIGYDVFAYNNKLEQINYNGTFENWCKIKTDSDLVFFSGVCGVLNAPAIGTDVVVPEGITDVKPFLWGLAYKIEKISLPDSLKTIGQYAFYGCEKLESVTISSNVNYISQSAFYDNNIKSITVDSANPNFSSDIYGVLFNKSKTELIRYPQGNTQTSYAVPDGVIKIKQTAFYGCNNLTSVTIPDSVTSIGVGAFYDCNSLTDVYYSGTEEEWNNIVIMDENDFSDVHIYFLGESSGICNENISWYTDTTTKTLVISGTGNIPDYNNSNRPWYDLCSYYETVKIGNRITGIGTSAFRKFENMTSVIIPKSITTIGNRAFYGCNNLTDVYYSGTEEEWNAISINSNNEPLLNATIHFNYNPCTHSYTSTIITPATCTENGEKVKKCVNCATVLETEEIPATGHTQGEWVISIEPTCTEEGEKIANCTECGIVVANDVVPATGHTAGEIEVVTPATCTENGEGTGSCVVCGEVLETVEIPATGHTAGAWETILEPTTETEGKKVKKCTACAEILEEATIAKLPKEPVKDNAVVKSPSTSTINYGDAIILHVDESRIPEGGRVEWTASNSNFEWTANGATCEISPEKSGDTTFTATIYDADGNPVSVDEQTMTSKAGFFQKIIAFFKGLFGLNKTIPNVFKF